MSVVGARPQFVKLAPMSSAITAAGHEHIIVHTGQHYDPMLSDVFFRDLNIPAPHAHLGAGSGSHGTQTGIILSRMDEVLERFQPDCVLVYGDTNSTLAATLSAVKMHVPVAHLEAGLRSFNRRMPEEHNRVLTDHAADLCLAPTKRAMELLEAEGLAGRSHLVGDVMTDVLYAVRDTVSRDGQANQLRILTGGEPYFLSTLHRAETTDDPDVLAKTISTLSAAPAPVVLLAHPRLSAKAEAFGIQLSQGALIASPPLPYPQVIRGVLGSKGVVTDSGGLQKEAFLLRVPCTTVRSETEWVETVELGWNVLALHPDEILAGMLRPHPNPTTAAPYGDGHAAAKAVAVITSTIPG